MSDQFEASIEEAYERGVEAGRLDAVPPGTEPMKWCDTHDCYWEPGQQFCWLLKSWYRWMPAKDSHTELCVLEDPVGHWVTVKEETA